EASSNHQRVVLQDVKWVAHLPDAGSSHTRTNLPSGFVNCAADYTAPFRLTRTLRNRLKQKLAVSFLLASAHVASCGWLGIHEAHLQAFGFWVGIV
ncbi:MAG TPA: hypothetical protein VKJ65_12660, partial [Phycisphaerae bacterium]|nr:hypothetical protein [Phycisphaerae bacterium]